MVGQGHQRPPLMLLSQLGPGPTQAKGHIPPSGSTLPPTDKTLQCRTEMSQPGHDLPPGGARTRPLPGSLRHQGTRIAVQGRQEGSALRVSECVGASQKSQATFQAEAHPARSGALQERPPRLGMEGGQEPVGTGPGRLPWAHLALGGFPQHSSAQARYWQLQQPWSQARRLLGPRPGRVDRGRAQGVD